LPAWSAADADGLVEWIWSVHQRMSTHSHQIANSIVRVDGDRARSETYVTATLRTIGPPGKSIDILNRGRYLDRWSRRSGVWAIDHRLYVNDMTSVVPAPERPPARTTGTRDAMDPSHLHFDGSESDR
jgi:hypothetical protein